MTRTLVTCSAIAFIGYGLNMRSGFAECRPPAYRKGYVWEDKPSSVMLNISVKKNDLAPGRLVCLAAALRRHYSNRSQVDVLIFTSQAAAKHYTGPFVGDSPFPRKNWSLENHARYFLDAKKNEEYIVLMPWGQNRTFETRIMLPAATVQRCTLEFAVRCVLAMERVDYPFNALKAKVMGSVELRGRIRPDGIVGDVQPIVAEASPAGEEKLLVDSALQNLATWKFETAPHTDTFRVIYSYVIEPGVARTSTTVSLQSPGTIQIKAVSYE